MNPLDMSKEVVSIVSHSYEMATYSTPELRGIFNDWMGEIENEVLEYLKDRKKMDHNEVADHFRLKPESAIFILSKLAREGKIKMEASGTGKLERPDNYTD